VHGIPQQQLDLPAKAAESHVCLALSWRESALHSASFLRDLVDWNLIGAMLGERNSSSDVELHNSNVFTENVTEGEAKIEVQKGYKPPPGSGGWQNVVEHWDDFSWKQRLGKIRTWQVAHMSEVLKEEGEEEMQQKYALRKQILPPGTALELLALCASVAISLSLLITLVGRAIFAHRWTVLNDDGCRNYEDGCSNQYDGWLAVPTEEGEWALDAEEAHQCGRRAMLVSASE